MKNCNGICKKILETFKKSIKSQVKADDILYRQLNMFTKYIRDGFISSENFAGRKVGEAARFYFAHLRINCMVGKDA
jgi:hypothetical protein